MRQYLVTSYIHSITISSLLVKYGQMIIFYCMYITLPTLGTLMDGKLGTLYLGR